jgi:nitrite reductase/ring-hydroxylating ferredoxin subunit
MSAHVTIQKEVDVDGKIRWVGLASLKKGEDQTPILVFPHQDGYKGVALLCKHGGAPLTYSTINDDLIICPLHGFQYDLNGKYGISFNVERHGDNFIIL